MPYAELHAHTAFSLLDGAALPEPLVARAKELGLAALAITDHDELGGIVRFATAAREVGAAGDHRRGAHRHDRAGRAATRRSSRTCPSSPSRARATRTSPRSSPSRGRTWRIAASRASRSTSSRRTPMDSSRSPAARAAGCRRSPRADETDAACEAAATLMDIFDRRVAIECWDHGLPEERVTTRAAHRDRPRARRAVGRDERRALRARARPHGARRARRACDTTRRSTQMGTRLRPERRVVPQERGADRAAVAREPRRRARHARRRRAVHLPARPAQPDAARVPAPRRREPGRVSRAARRAGRARAVGTHPARRDAHARRTRSRSRTSSRSSRSSGSRATSSSSGTSCASRGARGSSARGAARPPTPPSATASASPRSIRSGSTSCSSAS